MPPGVQRYWLSSSPDRIHGNAYKESLQPTMNFPPDALEGL